MIRPIRAQPEERQERYGEKCRARVSARVSREKSDEENAESRVQHPETASAGGGKESAAMFIMPD